MFYTGTSQSNNLTPTFPPNRPASLPDTLPACLPICLPAYPHAFLPVCQSMYHSWHNLLLAGTIMDNRDLDILLILGVLVFHSSLTHQSTYNRESESLLEIPENITNTTTRILLKQNDISILNCERFDGLLLNTYLDLSRNELTTIPPKCFVSMPGLQTLKLNDNQIDVIYNSSFAGLYMLEELNIAENMLANVPQGFLEGLNELQIVYLHKNLIEGKQRLNIYFDQ